MRGFDVSSGIVGKSHHHFSWRVDKEFRDWAYDRNENNELDSDGTGGVADELNVDYFITGEDGVLLPIGPSDVPDGQFSSDVFASSAEQMIRSHFASPVHQERPLFAYIATTAPHKPLVAPESDEQHVLDTRAGGQSVHSDALITAHPYFGVCPWRTGQAGSCATTEADATEARSRLTYEAMVRSVDRLLGRLEATLLNVGQWNDTLLVFSSDNGGDAHGCQKNHPLRGNKGSFFEGGIRVVAGMTGGYLPPHFRGLAANTLIHQTDMCAPPSPLTLCPSLPVPDHGLTSTPTLKLFADMRALPTSLGWATDLSTRLGRVVRAAMTQTASTSSQC